MLLPVGDRSLPDACGTSVKRARKGRWLKDDGVKSGSWEEV